MPTTSSRQILLLCLFCFSLLCGSAKGAAEIPTIGRPADLPFSEASGDFRVSARAEPTVLEAQTPLTFVLRVEAIAPVRQPPRRIDMRELPAFAERFDFLEVEINSEHRPNPQTWEFVYRIQPKRDDVTAIPEVPFVFYNPDIQYPRKGFQVAYTDPTPLTVRPHEVFAVPLNAPDALLRLATGPDLLAHQPTWAPPGLWFTVFLILGPPSLCAAWYCAWRRMYPGAAALVRQRRSLAARRALLALRASDRLPPDQQAAWIAAAVAGYLRSRCDATALELSPADAADCLQRSGCPQTLVESSAQLVRDCDAARFSPDGTKLVSHLPDAARRFILDVEAETWAASHSS